MPSTARQLRQPPTIEAIGRVPYFPNIVIFQKQINSILGEHLDKFIIVYLNNIIIYLKNKGEYREHVK